MTGDQVPVARYQFADMTLEVGQRQVMRGSVPIPLGKLTFNLLHTLVRAAPDVVTHEQAAAEVWGGRIPTPETVIQRIKLLRDALSDSAHHPRYVAIVRGYGYRLIPQVRVLHEAPVAPTGERSIAVLLFINHSPNPEDAYLAAGVHDEIINKLARVPGLRVIARASMLKYADGVQSIREIARELQVETVLEGSVHHAAGRVRITAQLIDAATSQCLWSEVYERQLADALAIQCDIASKVVEAIGADLPHAEWQRIDHPGNVSPEAYSLFLKLRGDSSLSNYAAHQHEILDRIIGIDPNFPSPYALKAELYAWSLIDTIAAAAVSPAERVGREHLVHQYAEQALVLDPNNATAHRALADLNVFRWRWREAALGFERAYELGATDELLRSYAWFNAYVGEQDIALHQARRVVSLNPKDWSSWWILGTACGYAGQPSAAISALQHARELAPMLPIVRLWLAHAQISSVPQHHAEALSELHAAEQLLGEPGGDQRLLVYLPELAHAYARLGRMADARQLFGEIEMLQRRGRAIGAGTWAQAYLAIGERGRALEWLHAAIDRIRNHEADQGFLGLMFLKANVLADPILEYPEFVEARSQLRGN